MAGNRIGTHIINKWPENAMKALTKQQLQPGKWHHLAMTYTGSGNAAGIRMYIDGKPAESDQPTNQLSATIRTTVPLKLGQRNAASPLEGVALQDLRIYSRALETQQ